MRSQRANVRRGSELSNRNELLQNAVQQSAVAQRQNLDPTPAPSPAVEGISQPLWVDSQLLLARRVESAGTTLIQGCWLDWPRIKQELLDSIRPLLPDADDVIVIRPMAYLSFTFDHRILDGQGADGFLAAVKAHLEAYSG